MLGAGKAWELSSAPMLSTPHPLEELNTPTLAPFPAATTNTAARKGVDARNVRPTTTAAAACLPVASMDSVRHAGALRATGATGATVGKAVGARLRRPKGFEQAMAVHCVFIWPFAFFAPQCEQTPIDCRHACSSHTGQAQLSFCRRSLPETLLNRGKGEEVAVVEKGVKVRWWR